LGLANRSAFKAGFKRADARLTHSISVLAPLHLALIQKDTITCPVCSKTVPHELNRTFSRCGACRISLVGVSSASYLLGGAGKVGGLQRAVAMVGGSGGAWRLYKRAVQELISISRVTSPRGKLHALRDCLSAVTEVTCDSLKP